MDDASTNLLTDWSAIAASNTAVARSLWLAKCGKSAGRDARPDHGCLMANHVDSDQKFREISC